jgi:GH43 family beta-xylosidase
MKKWSISLTLRNTNQNQIKIPVYSPRMAITKNTNNNKCCGECGEKGAITHCSWEFKLVQTL